MEQYKEKVKVGCYITGGICVILAAFSIFCFAAEGGLVELTPIVGDSHWQSKWRGFIAGASAGVLVYMIISLVKSIRALKDAKKLKQLYIKENDERQQQIYTAARAAAMQLTTALGLVATMIAGYFNITVCLTILGCTWFLALAGVGFKFYYSKKF